MNFTNNVTMNNVKKNLNNNVQCNNVTKEQILRADRLADRIQSSLNADITSRPFYCKVAYALSESQIINNLEQALRGNNPQRYFTWLCKKDMC